MRAADTTSALRDAGDRVSDGWRVELGLGLMNIDELNASWLASNILRQEEATRDLLARLATSIPDPSRLTTSLEWPTLPTSVPGLTYVDASIPGYAGLLGNVYQAGLLGASRSATSGLLGLDYLAASIPDFQKVFPPHSAHLAAEDLQKVSRAAVPYIAPPAPYVQPSATNIAALSAAIPSGLLGGALYASHTLHDLSSIGVLSAQLSSSITANTSWAAALSHRASADALVSSLSGLTRSADRAATFLRDLPASHAIFAAGFPYAAPYFEGFTGSHAVELLAKGSADGERETTGRSSIVDEIEGATRHDVGALLSDLGGEFLTQMIGARTARRSSNPDRSRHVCVSLRELLTGVLHELAPDEEIVRWRTGPGLIEDGRPTRRGRVLYLCRHINSGVCEQFVESDVKLTLALFQALQAGTHGRQITLTDSQLDALILRVETQLVFLLKLSRRG